MGLFFVVEGLIKMQTKLAVCLRLEKEQTCLPGGGGGRWPLDDLLLCWCFS